MMARPEFEALYGGAAGGGKSDYLLVEATRQVGIGYYRGIIFRKTYPELEDLISRSQELYPRAFPKARYHQSRHAWLFPSGAVVYFGAMQHTKDKLKYQGRHFDFVGFDELTHFAYEEYEYMFSRARSSGPGLKVYVRSTANPGGPGHIWVKGRFITDAVPGVPRTYTSEIILPDGSKQTVARDRIFIPSSVFDNPILMRNNPGYIANLAMMDEAQKKALLYGDWDAYEGQVFTEWRNDPENYDTGEWTHVIAPFKIPAGWAVMRAYDFGYAKPFSVGWYAIDYDGCIYRIREMYGCKPDKPNTGIEINPGEQAKRIREIEQADGNLKGRHITGVADPPIFSRDRGESIADIMAKYGVYWTPGDNSRIAGKMQYHYRLAFNQEGKAMFYVFNTCKDFIRTVPQLVYDEKKVEDIDTTQEDHIYDECRYLLMEHQIPQRQNFKKPVPLEDPLNLYENERRKAYHFRRA